MTHFDVMMNFEKLISTQIFLLQSLETAKMDSESEFEPQPVSGIEQTIHVKKYEEPLGKLNFFIFAVRLKDEKCKVNC